jgi:hypothetical protein
VASKVRNHRRPFRFLCSYRQYARQHRRVAKIRDQNQGVHSGLPLRGSVDMLGKSDDVVASAQEGDEHTAVGKGDRVFELREPIPGRQWHLAFLAAKVKSAIFPMIASTPPGPALRFSVRTLRELRPHRGKDDMPKRSPVYAQFDGHLLAVFRQAHE